MTMDLKASRGNIHVKKIGNKFLITTFYGAWDILSEEEYEALRRGGLSERLERKGLIVTDRNIDSIRKKIRSRYNFLLHPPSLHVVAITDRCNYNCDYCHSNSNTLGRDMDEETARSIADFILSTPSLTLTVEFQGGEPLLNYPVLGYFLEYMECNRGERIINYRMVTNLSEMDEDIFKELSGYNVRISTSLDGPRELHDRHRGGGSYDNVVYWMEYGRQNYHRINALPTITRYSLQYAREIIDEYLRQGIPLIRMRPVAFMGRAISNWNKIGISVDEYIKFWRDSLEYCIELCKNGEWIVEDSTLIILRRLLTDYSDYMCFRSPCGAGIDQLAYNPQGYIFPCDSARSYEEFIIGDVHSPFNDIMEKTAYLRGIANMTTICDSCIWSSFCGTCLICSYSHSHAPLSIKPRDFNCILNRCQLEYVIRKLLSSDRYILLKWLVNSLPRRIYEIDLHP